MPFIFKGGTSLLVLLDHPRRLSTDIDIIVDKDTDLDDYISKAGTIFPSKPVSWLSGMTTSSLSQMCERQYYPSSLVSFDIEFLLKGFIRDIDPGLWSQDIQ